MNRTLRNFLDRWAYALLPGISVLALYPFLSGGEIRRTLLLVLLALWTLALSAAAQRWERVGAPLLLFVTLGAMLLFCDRAALGEYLAALLEQRMLPGTRSGEVAALALAFAAAFLGRFVLPQFAVRCVLSPAAVGAWVYAAVCGADVPKLALAAALPLLLLTIFEALGRLRARAQRGWRGETFAGLLALLSLCVLLAAAPSPDEPYPFPLAHKLLNKAEELYRSVETRLFYRTVGTDQFVVAFDGLPDDATLRGSAKDDETPGALYVQAATDGDGVYYLSGNSWDRFDGRAWTSTVDHELDGLLDWNMDTAEHIFALYRLLGTHRDAIADDYARSTNAYVSYHGLSTRSLFLPGDTQRIYTDEYRYPYQVSSSRVLFDYLQERDAWYRVYYLRWNADRLGELLAAAGENTYDEHSVLVWDKVAAADRSRFRLTMAPDARIEQRLARRQALIERTYLTLPEDLSPQVRALAADLTAGCETDYEKLNAIAAYLRENYTYTTRPAAAPEGTAMLDWLLFESKEGYCTWFASAAAILARAAGVPTRYVQGCRVELKSNYVRTLDASNIHAWCEGYVAGWGWVTVEATPGHSAPGVRWEKSGTVVAAGANETSTGAPVPVDADAPSPAARGVRWLPLAVGGVLIAALLLLAALWAHRRAREKRRYEEASYTGRAILDCRALLRDLARRGFVRREEQSLREFFDAVHWRNMLADEAEAKRLAALYEEAMFGRRALTEEEWLSSQRFVSQFRTRRWHVRSWTRGR